MSTDVWAEWLTCELCHHRGEIVEPGLAHFRSESEPYQRIDRCTDYEACRRRVEDRGDTWPLTS